MEASVLKKIDPKHEDTKDLLYGHHTPRELHRRKISKIQSEYTKKHKPYCFTCAKSDFEEQQKNVNHRKPHKLGPDHLPIKDFDTDKYGHPTYFHLEDTQEIRETKILDGIKVPVVLSEYKHYRCKPRQHRISVQVRLNPIQRGLSKKK